MSRAYASDLRPVLGALLLASAPHVTIVPLWVTCWCLLLWGYVAAAPVKGWPRPSKAVLAVMTFGGFYGALISYGGALYSDTYVAMLAVMSALKPLEIESYRDRMVTLFLAYFLIISGLLYTDALGMTLYMFASVLVTTAVLIHLHHPSGTVRHKFRLAGRLMVQALPMMCLLFVLFPRVQSSFLGLTRQSGGTSGFSDRMAPGSISAIVNSDEIAFRAQFISPVPPPEKRYWRGIVFLFFDGRGWYRGMSVPATRKPVFMKSPVEYAITLEPHRERWLFALDLPGTVPEKSVILSDNTLISRHPVDDRKLYRMTSYLDCNTGPFQQWEQITQKLPPDGNPEARHLAATWAQNAKVPGAIVAAALNFFRENEFVYTLRPPLLGKDSVDDFLFRTRKGYCEHYASAFTFLMRAANVPARVVGGYLGGELNPYGNYLIVRQADAHAWAEVWLPGKGWTRVDPTAVVAPERLTGLPETVLGDDALPDLFRLPDLGALSDYLTLVRLGWDAVNTYWFLWVMGYSFQDQSSLLAKLGIHTDSWKWILQTVMLAAGGLLILTLFFAIGLYRKSAARPDEIQQIYNRFCKKLSKGVLPRGPSQGPRDYAEQVIAARPDLKDAVNGITSLYIRLRYGPAPDADMLKAFRSEVRHFSLSSAGKDRTHES
ncbi:DUF3488 domain-containing protein [Desulfonema ishimotonii]|uniref:DUF3488 domain-containing protein n=1 Tax=Desulfonema ishimotonii TaxID=45657 RepID=A0A401G1S3_9BACT|nr:DUF3488 and transglutaminase-like domain-containing protein [Desulfonema ishimotonii]GBC63172.1 DUF3488 domain-containing protein [Desulfonema ishimotonii]